ncbi:MAG TPA: MamK family actin-like protein [Tepidisphaeraceae bacterium]|nr:MamK family actin-like protein [Tepidisphaeraceae bacterium]
MADAAKTLRPTIGKPITAGRDIDTGENQDALLMGIDLGTSRSSIVSASGVRKTVESYVGYAKDAVSRKFLKTDVLFGKAALDNRLAVDLYRPLEKGVIKGTFEGEGGTKDAEGKNILAAKDLIRHLVELVNPHRDELLYGVIGVPSLASQNNKQAIIEAAKDTFDAVMLVSEPFTVAYGMERMSDILVIDIGAGTSDLCRMHGTVPGPDDEISYPIAGDAVDSKLLELIQKRYPKASVTQNMCKTFKEQYGYVSDTKDKIMVDLPVDGKPTPHDITDLMKEACEILVDPITEGVFKLISSFNPEYQHKLRNNVLLAGGGGLMRGLNTRLQENMKQIGGGTVNIVEEPMYAGANGALQLATDMPADFWQQLR